MPNAAVGKSGIISAIAHALSVCAVMIAFKNRPMYKHMRSLPARSNHGSRNSHAKTHRMTLCIEINTVVVVRFEFGRGVAVHACSCVGTR